MSRTRPYHHGNLQQALIEAAIEIIGAEGLGGFQLRAVARKAGVSPSAPYRHFEDKAALLRAVAAAIAHQLVEATRVEMANVADDPLIRFRAQGVAFVKWAVAHPAHFRVMNLPEVWPSLDEEVRALTGGRDLLAEAVAESEEAGQLATDNPAAVALTARALVYGLARMIADGHLGETAISVEEAEQLALKVTEVLGLGLFPRA